MASRLILASGLALAGLVLFAPLPLRAGQPAERHLTLQARSFAFEPAVIQVNQGDRVVLEVESVDATHGIYLDGYDLSVEAEPGRPARLAFTADRLGSFRFRCSVACGNLHPFMIGQLKVGSNLPFWRALGALGVVTVGAVWFFGRNDRDQGTPDARRIELTQLPWLKRALKNRWLQWSIAALMLAGFVLAILTGFWGTPVGSRNFGVIFVWIVWWAAVIALLVPLAGRLWCAVCPLPLPGEWLQRRALVTVRPGSRLHTLGLKWPRALRNIWLQNAVFLGVALFSAVILTHARVTALMLASVALAALGLGLAFERRVFCRYLCPVGGFVGLYSLVAPLELRVKNPAVCRAHKTKDCYVGNENGYGCPWMVYPGTLERNAYCGLCNECLRTCPLDNVALNLRPPGADLIPGAGTRRLDEAYKGFIMLGSALLYSAVLLGPWAELKEAAYAVFTLPWLGYAVGFLVANLLLLPGLFLGAVAVCYLLAGADAPPLRQRFVEYAYVLVPLGLAAWIAFSCSFVLINLSYAWPLLSDPFGWGWNLFGTAGIPWTPYLSDLVPILQVLILLVGLVAAIGLAFRIARGHGLGRRARLAALPMAGFYATVTAGFLWLYLG
ncbi:MAG: 4Fe-4S binding protein [Promethearchaeota archaeon]